MESEMNFVGFLPQEQRLSEIRDWYTGADKRVHQYLDSYYQHGVLPAPFAASSHRPKEALYR